MGFAGVVCCGGPFVVLVVALVGATLLRAAVAAANRVLGPAAPPDAFGQWDDWDSDEPGPAATRAAADRVVPEPTLITGGAVAFAAGLVDLVRGAVLVAFFDIDPGDSPDETAAVVLLLLFELPASTLIHAVLLAPLLPTTFGRAALVSLFYHLIAAAVVVAIGVAAVLVGYLAGL